MKLPVFNDRIITEGFPKDWYIQDRLDDNVALLCRKSIFSFGGSICICLRPKAITTDEWLPYAKLIAEGFDIANAAAPKGGDA